MIAKRDDQELGRDTGRFLVYQDDRELENPSADLALARQIASITEGESVTPEKLTTYLKGLDRSAYTEYVSAAEHRVWDNWPFLLIFATLLTLEWWLRSDMDGYDGPIGVAGERGHFCRECGRPRALDQRAPSRDIDGRAIALAASGQFRYRIAYSRNRPPDLLKDERPHEEQPSP